MHTAAKIWLPIAILMQILLWSPYNEDIEWSRDYLSFGVMIVGLWVLWAYGYGYRGGPRWIWQLLFVGLVVGFYFYFHVQFIWEFTSTIVKLTTAFNVLIQGVPILVASALMAFGSEKIR